MQNIWTFEGIREMFNGMPQDNSPYSKVYFFIR